MSAEPAFRASAPVRLDFAGGWTDVAPFATERGGVVVNAAIALCAHAEVRLGGTGLRLDALDLERRSEVLEGCWTAQQRVDFPLQKAALDRAGIHAGSLTTRSDVPQGSGLGASGALGVALVGVLEAALARNRPAAALAEEAFLLESEDAQLPGGRQDQYAAALGGVHRLGFGDGPVRIEPLELDRDFAAALSAAIVLCYTGTSRVSSRTIARVMGGYRAADRVITSALLGLVEVAERMAEALRAADLAATGRWLSENWRLQQQLDAGMCTPEMARLEQAMRDAGSLGGKAAGAGAGGSMFFIAKNPARAARAAQEAGARLLPVEWAAQGIRCEQVA